MKIDLPIIDSCDDCGACCMEQTTPPGFSAYAAGRPEFWGDPDDYALYLSAPIEAKQLIVDQVERLRNREFLGEVPCCWLDLSTMRCRFYDHRPGICRGFDVGSEGCRAWRDEYNIDVEELL